jgi:molecular chaperone GrpE
LVAEGGTIETDDGGIPTGPMGIPPDPISSADLLTPTDPDPSRRPAGPGEELTNPAAGDPSPAERPDADEQDPAVSVEATDEDAANATADQLAAIRESVSRLADSAELYHARAKQRESVIDHLSSEVDRLRRGDRRGVLRPLLAEVCRLRNDLLRQADELPVDFDAERARLLLRSYAESVEVMLEDNGVLSYSPGEGDPFDPRMHRRVGDELTTDLSAAGHVAAIRRSGYLDVEASSTIAPAEVVLFRRSPAASGPEPATDERTEQ